MASLLSPSQVAEILGIKTKTLTHWRWQGVGPRYVKLRSNVMYRPEDIHDFVNSSVVEPYRSNVGA